MTENETPDEQPVGALGSFLPRILRDRQLAKAAESELTEALKTAVLTGADVHDAPQIKQ